MAVEQTFITSDAELERIYGAVAKPSLTKGLDVSPRGDPAGFVVIEDAKTLLLPDRRGNNRIDSLRNILHDNRVALLFLIPGIGETLRVNGTAKITTDPELLHRFAVNHQLPKTVLRIAVESVFFQCSRAIIRSKLWDPAVQIKHDQLPSPGSILHQLSRSEINGDAYDQALPERLKNTLY
ncbi:MAG: pyridoxamine 5'-phosphate oxidase family protein [Pantoea sp.]|nr:pyridoxamine 5'-phosphate oxidase family protein [Pantoea sp.]